MIGKSEKKRWFRKVVKAIGMHNIGLSVSSAILMVGMSLNYEYFLSWTNMEVLAMGFILESIMAIGMTLVIISGGIDLSVSAVLPLTAVLTGFALNAGVPIVPAIIISLVVAGVVGFLNATMASKLSVHPFIATLATMLMLRGINLVITGGATVSGFPKSFCFLGQGEVFGVPMPLIVFAALAFGVGYCLKNHRFFQQVYFIGSNRRAARMSGIKVERFLVFVYVTSAVLAGIAGVIAAAQYGSASNTFGQGSELKVITAVVIGGASLRGGLGTISGTVLGVLFLAIVNNAFVMTGVSSYWQDVVNGSMLLIAVFLGEYLKKRGLRS
jgi:ribose transport system permease protein